jgi:hypothetical protein
MYAQGVPLLITFVTWIIDQRRIQLQKMVELGQIPDFDTTSYPEAGLVSCYLSYQVKDPNNRPSYFFTPEFIYVQYWQFPLWISNMLLFGMSVKAFFKFYHTHRHTHFIKIRNNLHVVQMKKSCLIIAKLFSVMGGLLILKIIASNTSNDDEFNGTCTIWFFKDVPNAFFGLWVFFVVVCMPKVAEACGQHRSLKVQEILLTTRSYTGDSSVRDTEPEP